MTFPSPTHREIQPGSRYISLCMRAQLFSRVPLFETPWTPTRLLCAWDFPGKNPGVGCHFLLQRILLTWGLNQALLCLLHLQADSLPLRDLGSPKVSSSKFLKKLVNCVSSWKLERDRFNTRDMIDYFMQDLAL